MGTYRKSQPRGIIPRLAFGVFGDYLQLLNVVSFLALRLVRRWCRELVVVRGC